MNDSIECEHALFYVCVYLHLQGCVMMTFYTQLASSYSMKRDVPRGHSLLSDHILQVASTVRVDVYGCISSGAREYADDKNYPCPTEERIPQRGDKPV